MALIPTSPATAGDIVGAADSAAAATLTDQLAALASQPIVWFAAAAILAVLYAARRPVHGLIDAAFIGVADVFSSSATKIASEEERVSGRLNENILDINVQDHELRLLRYERTLGNRVQRRFDHFAPIADNLKRHADGLDDAAQTIRNAVLSDDKLREFGKVVSDAMGKKTDDRAVNAAVSKLRDSLRTESRAVAEAVGAVRPNAQGVQEQTDRLRKADLEISRHTRDINDAAERYEELVRSRDRKRAAIGASALVPWAAALIVLFVALAGALFNYQLIARPMAELVGDGDRIGGVRMSELAAIALILLEAATGLILMEALGITRMLPNFDRMGGRVAGILAAGALAFLAVFSVVEIFLAFLRESIIQGEAALLLAATGSGLASQAAEAAPASTAFPYSAAAQALLGAVIPWILAIAAIPLETFLKYAPVVVQVVWRTALALSAFVLGLAAGFARTLGRLLAAVYDLVIFIPMMLEALARFMFNAPRTAPAAAPVRSERPARAKRAKRSKPAPAREPEPEFTPEPEPAPAPARQASTAMFPVRKRT